MRVHLINPSEVSFGTAVITPRWLYVLAAATPETYGDAYLVDETLDAVDPDRIQAGDIVGIGIHTANALRGYEIGKLARERGARVVFGGIHATLYPNEAHELGGADAVVRGDGDVVWAKVLSDCCHGTPQKVYGREYSGIVAMVCPREFTKEDASKPPTFCRRAGIWCHEKVICGPQYKPFAVVPSIVLSVPFGELTDSVRDSAPPM